MGYKNKLEILLRKFVVGSLVIAGLDGVLFAADEPKNIQIPMVSWEKYFKGIKRGSIQPLIQTNDKGYVIAGDESGGSLGCIIKVDSKGEELWRKKYGSRSNEFDFIKEVPEGFIAVGQIEKIEDDVQKDDVYVVKTDSNGEVIWENSFGSKEDEWGAFAVETKDKGYIVVGTTYSSVTKKSDIYAVKINDKGNKTWEKNFGGKGNDGGNCIIKTKDENYVISGFREPLLMFTTKLSIPRRSYLMKIDEHGNKLWERLVGSLVNGNEGEFVQQTSDDGYVVVACSSVVLGEEDFYITKVDKEGNRVWEKIFQNRSNNWGFSVRPTKEGYIGVGTGWINSQKEAFLFKTDNLGNKLWEINLDIKSRLKQRNIEGGDSWARAVQQTKDLGYIILGDTFSSEGLLTYLIKIAPEKP